MLSEGKNEDEIAKILSGCFRLIAVCKPDRKVRKEFIVDSLQNIISDRSLKRFFNESRVASIKKAFVSK